MQTRPAPPSEPMQISVKPGQPLNVLQLTDCHLGHTSEETLLGLNTEQSFIDVLEHPPLQSKQFDLITCTGDIGSAGREECYERFLQLLRRHRTEPLAWLPGNHDSPAKMATVASQWPIESRPESRLIESDDWLIIMLDSSVRGQVYGEFSDQELDFLSQSLAYGKDKNTLLMLHHQVEPVGCAWIDQYTLKNSDALFNLTDHNPQVKAIAWGHVHQDYQRQTRGPLLLSSPSTCIQFSPNSDDFKVDEAMPGYRTFKLFNDGKLNTQIERISQRHYPIDYQSGGY